MYGAWKAFQAHQWSEDSSQMRFICVPTKKRMSFDVIRDFWYRLPFPMLSQEDASVTSSTENLLQQSSQINAFEMPRDYGPYLYCRLDKRVGNWVGFIASTTRAWI